MIKELHLAKDRGYSDLGWLQTNYSFSFANYYNPNRMGFGKLRVINDDIIAPGEGFGTHPHNNMEIISIVTSGILEHKDSMNNIETISSNEIQVMSAGSGITHSEYNHSIMKEVKLFQIWIEPKQLNIKPRHDKKEIKLIPNKITKVVSGDKDFNLLNINQDANIFIGEFDKEKEITHEVNETKGAFILIMKGSAIVEDEKLKEKDAIAIKETNKIKIKTEENSKILIIEVPF